MGTLLELSQALHFALFLFLDPLLFTSFGLFALYLITIVIRNLLIYLFLGLASRDFLLFSILIGNPDFFVHDLELLPLGGKFLSIFSFDLLNVGKKLGFLHLGLVLLPLAVDLTLRNLIDDDLSAALPRLCSTLFSGHLLLDRLQSLDFHHHV